MSQPQAQTWSKSKMLRILAGSLVRTVLGCAVIWVALALVPERPNVTLALPVLIIFGGTAIYGLFFARELKRIRRAKYPAIVAGEAMILVAVMFLAVFAAYYVMISNQDPAAFTEPLDHFTAYYFAITVLATVGFGDITPVTPLARIVTMVQMGIDIVFIAVVVKLVTTTAQNTRLLRQQQQGQAQ